MADHPLCSADDCPCFLSGVEMTRAELADRHAAVIEAMTGLVEMLNAVTLSDTESNTPTQPTEQSGRSEP